MPRIQPRTGTSFDCLVEPVISDIFAQTWHLSNGAWSDLHQIRTRTQTRIPYTLASVSRHWRAIALTTSRIWSFVDLLLPPEALTVHLARSKNLPIEVELITYEDSNAHDVQESLHILEETSSWARIRYLNAILNRKHARLLAVAFNNAIDAGTTGTIQTITLQRNPFEDVADGLYPHIPPFQPAYGVGIGSIGLPLSPLRGLEDIDFKYVEVPLLDSLFPFLDLTPNFTRLSLGHCWVQSGVTGTRPRHSILLSNLKELRLNKLDRITTVLNMLFQTLDTPNLEFLEIICTYSAAFRHELDLDAICRNRALKCLYLTRMHYGALLRLFPQLHNLGQLKQLALSPDKCRNIGASVTFVGQLAGTLLQTCCCPALRELSLPSHIAEEATEIINELGRTRPSLNVIRVQS
ncbi:hypothetical protein FRC12_018553 [Ceratobasidium sp. 428]|nr:hypothetical protein FRC12_018553 [Ceratobasidium sp. 428]